MSDCVVCQRIIRDRWLRPPPQSHCRVCHRSWTSLRQAHCTVCHEHFGSNGAADRHWLDEGHVHPSSIDGLELRSDLYGPVWVQAMDGAAIQRLRSAPGREENSAAAELHSDRDQNPAREAV
jgi:hypothetical protein